VTKSIRVGFNATVICKLRFYRGSGSYSISSYYNCPTRSGFYSCSFTINSDCSHYDDVAIVCTDHEFIIAIKLLAEFFQWHKRNFARKNYIFFQFKHL